MLGKHRKAVVIGVLALAVAGAGFVYLRKGDDDQPAYREVAATRGDIAVTILSTGVVQPQNRLEIKPPIAGRAEEVLVKEGDVVKKGQILAWMSSTERAALIDAARAKGPEELKRWEELYRPTPVLAPIDGVIILRNIEPGQTFTATDAVLVMSDRLIVMAQVDETDIAQIKLKQRAGIVLDAYPDRPFDGRVDQIAYDATTVNNVTTYNVEVLPDKVPSFMRSGMTANVSFVTASRKDVPLVPSEAIAVRNGEPYVLVAPEKGGAAPQRRVIKTGLTDGKHTEVLDGIAPGERVLVKRLQTGLAQTGTNPFMPFGRHSSGGAKK
jgi:membrane fusion protein, macrolide-specific efflux system